MPPNDGVPGVGDDKVSLNFEDGWKIALNSLLDAQKTSNGDAMIRKLVDR